MYVPPLTEGLPLVGAFFKPPGLFAKIPHAMDPATQSDRLSTSVNKQPMEPWIKRIRQLEAVES